MASTFVPLLSRAQIEQLPSRAREVVEYRKSGLSLNGPSGAGKSTVVNHLAQMLVGQGENVHVTAEPSAGPIGTLARELTETVTGHALACRYAADRYHHIDTEIRRGWKIAPSSSPTAIFLPAWSFSVSTASTRLFCGSSNAEADRPDLAVILEADPDVIAQRLKDRGPHNRFQLTPNSSHAEIHFYKQAAERLMQAGFEVLRVDCNQQAAHHVASHILDRLTTFFASPKESPMHGA